jgi:hypothetical protein
MPDAAVSIDGCFQTFRKPSLPSHEMNPQPEHDWVRATDTGAKADEYVSMMDVDPALCDQDGGIRGAFLNWIPSRTLPYTRLVNYSNIEDLRADNETFEKIFSTVGDDRELVAVVGADPESGLNYWFPRVYMGPGYWLNKGTRKIHLRLAHTHNNIEGLADYRGETDPRKVALALSGNDKPTLRVRGSSYVRLKNLSVRFGGTATVHIENTSSVTFDHVRFYCSEMGMTSGGNTNLLLQHCSFNGGLPDWLFRGDQKSEYKYLEGGIEKKNNLAHKTTLTLLNPSHADRGTEIHHCEFINSHDMYLRGDVKFHHNYVHNLNDDGLFVSNNGTAALISENVISKCLYSITRPDPRDEPSGPVYIFRNLIDQRTPTAGYRPGITLKRSPWRNGMFYKNGQFAGPLYFFQNTALIYTESAPHACFGLFITEGSVHQRCSFNNIFIAIDYLKGINRPITWLPTPEHIDITDGNLYHRIGIGSTHLLYHPAYSKIVDDVTVVVPGRYFASLDELYSSINDPIFEDSKLDHLPGYESNSLNVSPMFRNIDPTGKPQSNDDFRLKPTSPAVNKGILLPWALRELDPYSDIDNLPDMGCYRLNSAPLKVGVNGHHSFPDV